MAIPNSSFDEIVSTTLNKYSDSMADNIMNHNPLLKRLKAKGNTADVSGGAKITEQLMYAENGTKKWYSGLEVLDVTESDVLTSADFDWKQLNTNVVISGLDEAKNSGDKHTMHNLLKSRIRVAEITMQNEVAAALFYSNTENSGKSIGGLQHLVADLPTSGTVGSIDSATQAWWRNQFYDFSTLVITPSATTITAAMNNIAIATMRGTDKPDIYVGDQIYFTYYLESLQDKQRFLSTEDASAGFRGLKHWDGADVFYDSNCPASHMYALNTNYLFFRSHKDRKFKQLDRKSSINQDGTVIPLYWMGNMTVSNRSLQGLILA